MNDRIAVLLVLLGALLILQGCRGPLDVATATANGAAVALSRTRTEILAARKRDQEAAAARVGGPSTDPSVVAEKLDRAADVGKRYRPAVAAYNVAREAWLVVVVAIQVARELETTGKQPNILELGVLVTTLATAMRTLLEAVDRASGSLGGPLPLETQ